MNDEYIAYFNGDWMPFSDVRVDPLDRGFMFGDVVFDVERTFAGKSFRMKQHIDRLYRSLKYVRIDPGLTADEMTDITEEAIRRNEHLRTEVGDYALNQWVTRGTGGLGSPEGPPAVCVNVRPITFSRYARAYDNGQHGVITQTRSYPPEALDPKIKHHSRMNFNLATLEANDLDPGAWALLRDMDGNLSEGTGYNYFLVTDGVIRTAAEKAILQGVSRGTVIDLADQLGIPLVEVATAPDVTTPEHAKELALALGTLLRDTRRVRRGLGTIRQDLNVSIGAGDRVEIKGCQDLDWIPRIIRLEMARQLHFHRLANELRSSLSVPLLPNHRDLDSVDDEYSVAARVSSVMPLNMIEVTSAFSDSESKMIRDSISSGSVVLGLGLPGLSGNLGTKQLDAEGAQLPRLGRELASAAKLAGVKGIFHSDELPAYGITEAETTACAAALGDCYVLCVAPRWQAELALEGVLARARLAYHRIPQEVRNVVVRKGAPEDGTTTAMRPLPGGARMYPETDIPTVAITVDQWTGIKANLPPSRSERIYRLDAFGLSSNQVAALVSGELDDHFVSGIEGVFALPAKAWASALLDHGISNLSALSSAVHLIAGGEMTRDGMALVAEAPASDIPTLLAWMRSEAAARGYEPADTGAVDTAVAEVLAERADFVAERGMGAMGPLMGVVMGKLGGAADGKAVSAALKEQIQRLL